MGRVRVIAVLVGEDRVSAEGVDEGGSACGRILSASRDSVEVEVRGKGLGGVVDVPVPEAPHTMRQNWIPFFTFFFLRIIF
ncbi:hypothetical protein IMZ48_36360 [Candidatus Bathyarchaeota archaeon]|nr:hypothetical protein [Candidatus Bathyarchaeota archaeon]